MRITLDPGLEPITIDFQNCCGSEKFYKRVQLKDETLVKASASENLVLNYLNYLNLCYGNHRGYIITPDILWYTFLCEMANHIKKNSEKFRKYFTKSEGKHEVIIPGFGFEFDSIVMTVELSKYIPIDIKEFFPSFSTTGLIADLAFKSAFLDAVSPYYDYSMLICGFPECEILGIPEDYQNITENIQSIQNKLDGLLPDVWIDRFTCITNRLKSIKKNNSLIPEEFGFLKNIFYTERCGSGSQKLVQGWFSNLFITQPKVRYIYNYPSHASIVNYRNLNTKTDYRMLAGIFGVWEEDGFLIPFFERTFFKKDKKNDKL